jgi:electron transport complex protein RnfB
MASASVWQLDPQKCLRCGQCATACVLQPSAVRCFHAYEMCGYCKLCTGFFDPEPIDLNEGAENQLCPTAAIIRTSVGDPYYQYKIDKTLCIGCAKCVEGCNRFGNGSLYLQIQQDLCVRCNECAIARVCPADAFRRVPVSEPYLRKEIAH